jgi:hypothetical protein
VTTVDREQVLEALTRDLAAAGPRYAIVHVAREERLELRVDDAPSMWIRRSDLDGPDPDHVANVLDQVQDIVMESESEPWPPCPVHYHPLDPQPAGAWVAWRQAP